MGTGKKNIPHPYTAAEIVREVINLVTDPILQQLFSAIKENPAVAHQLDNDQIRTLIIETLHEKNKQACMKNVLDELANFKKIINDIGKLYDEHPSTHPAIFRAYQSPRTSSKVASKSMPPPLTLPLTLPHDPDAMTVGDISFSQISDFKNTSQVEYSSKLNSIAIFSRFLLVDIFKYTPQAVKNFLVALNEQQLQYKICEDFTHLKDWEQNFLSEGISRDYTHVSGLLSDALKKKGITHFTPLHKNILESLIESYQIDKVPEDTFYYLSGIRDNTLFVPFDVFGPLSDIEDPTLKQEVTQLMAMNQWLASHRGDEDAIQLHAENRKKLVPKLMPYVNKMLSKKNFEIIDLLREKRNSPGTHVENVHGLAIPISISGSATDMKKSVFQSLADGLEMNENEREKWLASGEIPRWFDIGYLVRGSAIQKTYTSDVFDSIDISNGFNKPGDIYPVIISHGVTVLLHDLSQFKRISKSRIFQNTPKGKDILIGNMLGEWIYNMLRSSPNIYKEIIDGSPAYLKNKFK